MTALKSNRWSHFFISTALSAISGWCMAQTASAPPTAEQKGPEGTTTFQANAHLALTDVVVTDKRGTPVHGLTVNDFHIFENGKEQKITSFEEHRAGDVVSSRAAAPAFPTNTYSNQSSTVSGNRVLNVILLDSLNTAISDQQYAQSELLHMVESLPQDSRVAVFRLGAGLTMLQGFSQNASDLVAALKNKTVMPQLGAFYNDENLSLSVNSPDPTAGMGTGGAQDGKPMNMKGDASEKAMQNDVVVGETIRSLKQLGRYLGQFPGRKNLIWLSGSFPIDTMPSTGSAEHGDSSTVGPMPSLFVGNRSYTIAVYDLAVLLQSAHIAVYPFDVRGVNENGLNNVARGGSGTFQLDTYNTQQTLFAFSGSNGQIHSIMETIANETGGRAYYGDNDLKGAMIQVLNDGSNYYTLSYSPTDQKWDGKFRKTRVQVDIAETKLYYRSGYYAEEPGKLKHSFGAAQPDMTAAMVRGGPSVLGIPVQLHLNAQGGPRTLPVSEPALRTRSGSSPVSHLTGPVIHYAMEYSIHASDIAFSSSSDIYHCNLAISVAAFDANGKMVNSSANLFHAPMKPATYEAIQRDGLHLQSQMDLPLGRVYLRVGVHDLITNKIGAFEIPIDVKADAVASR